VGSGQQRGRWPPLRVFSIATICRLSLGTNGNSQALAYVARALPDPSLVTGSGSRAPAEITPPSGPLQSAIPNLLAPASQATARQAGTQGARAIVHAITITSDCCGFRRSGSRRLAEAVSPIATVAICSAPSKRITPTTVGPRLGSLLVGQDLAIVDTLLVLRFFAQPFLAGQLCSCIR
jgi:hypothetical protein